MVKHKAFDHFPYAYPEAYPEAYPDGLSGQLIRTAYPDGLSRNLLIRGPGFQDVLVVLAYPAYPGVISGLSGPYPDFFCVDLFLFNIVYLFGRYRQLSADIGRYPLILADIGRYRLISADIRSISG